MPKIKMNITKFLKTSILLVILTLTSNFASAQFEEFEDEHEASPRNTNRQSDERLIDRLVIGGSFGLGFDSYTFYGEILPQVGYIFNDYVNAGAIATYMYTGYSDYYYDNFSQSVYGGGVYADIIPVRFLVLHAEAQAINFKEIFTSSYYSSYNLDAKRMWDYPVLVGAGYRMPFGQKSSVNYMLLFNINNTKPLQNNVYPGGVLIRIAFLF